MLSTHSRSVYYFIICYCEIFGQEQAIDHAFYISWEQFLRTKPTRGTALAKFYRCLAIDCRKTLTCTYITELALPCFDANLPAGKHEYRACSSKKYLAAKYTPRNLQIYNLLHLTKFILLLIVKAKNCIIFVAEVFYDDWETIWAQIVIFIWIADPYWLPLLFSAGLWSYLTTKVYFTFKE